MKNFILIILLSLFAVSCVQDKNQGPYVTEGYSQEQIERGLGIDRSKKVPHEAKMISSSEAFRIRYQDRYDEVSSLSRFLMENELAEDTSFLSVCKEYNVDPKEVVEFIYNKENPGN